MRKILLIISGFFFAVFLIIGFKISKFYSKIYTPKKNQPKQEKTTYNFLLFGYGGEKHEGPYLTDTIMLFHLNLKTKKAVLLSIPRDLWIKLPTKSGAPFHLKVNSLYQLEINGKEYVKETYPDLDLSHFGAKNDAEFTKFVLSQTFGIPIDYYGAIDFQGFIKVIDVLGGVDINVIKSFEDPQYPVDGKENDLCDEQTEELFKKVEPFLKPGYNPEDKERVFREDPKAEEFAKNATESPELAFPCRYEKLSFTKGLTHMDGKTALKYVRSRHSIQDGSDFGRAARQQQLLQAVKEKVISIGFIPKIIPLLDQLGDHIRTDFPAGEIKRFISFASRINEFELKTFIISDQNLLTDSWSDDNQFILVPKQGIDQWKDFQKDIKNIIEGTLPTTTPVITPATNY